MSTTRLEEIIFGEHVIDKGQLDIGKDNGIENIGKKVPYCTECKTADFDHDPIVHEIIDGKDKMFCPHCHDPLRMWSEDRIANVQRAEDTPRILGTGNSLPTFVTRTMTTPYGRLRIAMSNQSMQVYTAQFANAKGEFALPTKIDQEFWYPAMGEKAAAVKSVVNSEFSSAQKLLAFSKLGGTLLDFTFFMDRLKRMVDAVMEAGYSAPHTLDWDVVVLH